MTGIENIERLIDIDQSPIGRTPRSNPATYTGVFDDIRDLLLKPMRPRFAVIRRDVSLSMSKVAVVKPALVMGLSRLRCTSCLMFMYLVRVCHGTRYNSETLEVRYKGKNIAEILDMTVDDAVDFFAAIPKIARKVQTIKDVGLRVCDFGAISNNPIRW